MAFPVSISLGNIKLPPTEDLGSCAACGAKAELSPSGRRAAIDWWREHHQLGTDPVALCGTHWGMGINPSQEAELLSLIRSRRAASEIKVGGWAIGRNWDDETLLHKGQLVNRGNLTALIHHSGRDWCVRNDSLRRAEAPQISHVTDSNPDPEIEQFLPKQPKPDPYVANRASVEEHAGFAMWSAMQTGTASGLHEEAKKPERKNFGPCGDRDRYGQKKSLRGWPEAEDEEV
jgi:hypothetical protein